MLKAVCSRKPYTSFFFSSILVPFFFVFLFFLFEGVRVDLIFFCLFVLILPEVLWKRRILSTNGNYTAADGSEPFYVPAPVKNVDV